MTFNLAEAIRTEIVNCVCYLDFREDGIRADNFVRRKKQSLCGAIEYVTKETKTAVLFSPYLHEE